MTPLHLEVTAKIWCVHLVFRREDPQFIIRFSKGCEGGTRLCSTVSLGRYVWLALRGETERELSVGGSGICT